MVLQTEPEMSNQTDAHMKAMLYLVSLNADNIVTNGKFVARFISSVL